MFNITITYLYLPNSMTSKVPYLSNRIDKIPKHKIIQCFVTHYAVKIIIDYYESNKNATCALITKNISLLDIMVFNSNNNNSITLIQNTYV